MIKDNNSTENENCSKKKYASASLKHNQQTFHRSNEKMEAIKENLISPEGEDQENPVQRPDEMLNPFDESMVVNAEFTITPPPMTTDGSAEHSPQPSISSDSDSEKSEEEERPLLDHELSVFSTSSDSSDTPLLKEVFAVQSDVEPGN